VSIEGDIYTRRARRPRKLSELSIVAFIQARLEVQHGIHEGIQA